MANKKITLFFIRVIYHLGRLTVFPPVPVPQELIQQGIKAGVYCLDEEGEAIEIDDPGIILQRQGISFVYVLPNKLTATIVFRSINHASYLTRVVQHEKFTTPSLN